MANKLDFRDKNYIVAFRYNNYMFYTNPDVYGFGTPQLIECKCPICDTRCSIDLVENTVDSCEHFDSIEIIVVASKTC